MNPARGVVAMNPARGLVAMNPARGFATNPGAWIRDGTSSGLRTQLAPGFTTWQRLRTQLASKYVANPGASWVHCQPNHMSWVHCEPSRKPSRASWVHPRFAINLGTWVHHKPASWVRLKVKGKKLEEVG
ncbi:hypothetical protein SLEP1_g39672 [Rubroshorea leprosula]|uniref:Uncharacterized protein n=1 Tax=Rubroshorea leprosula TaxID=152421 RepID=A0AAV5L1B0_9ROSI|nr:hypothetical protein SLEP1_g39672 [Rubroshorea leprosula]